ncbi:hypothetical protein BGX31_002383 [Mortierella sp. GBA43]|nr:hypothetical protein BGX31_002383 [Mortierella sp. GBA43]
MAAGNTSFQPYGAYYPSYRPYTPSTPTTPTPAVHGVVATPMTPTSAVFRPEQSASGQSKAESMSGAGGTLIPYGKSQQRSSSTRRMPSSETSLYDPYRSRQPSVSANRVKNEYQTQSPIRESHGVTLPQYPKPYYSTHGSTAEVRDTHSQSGDDLSYMMPPPIIGQREDQHRYSPTLAASQTTAAGTYKSDAPHQQGYLPYQPYSIQHPLPSPSFIDAYRTSSNFSASPGLVPLYSPTQGFDEQPPRNSEQKTDPYRSAYSQANNQGVSNQSNPSLHHGSGKGSPNPNDEYSSSYESSRFSGPGNPQFVPEQEQQNSSNAQDTRYPTRDLAGQNSRQPLSASFYDLGDKDSEVAKKLAGAKSSDKDCPTTTITSAPAKHSLARPSTVHPAQPSRTDLATTKEEDEENDVILQKLGVLGADGSVLRGSGGGNRSVGTLSSRRSPHGKGQSDVESQRRSLATPTFKFDSVLSNSPPIVTNDRVRESFSIQVAVDSTNNYLPVRLDSIDMTIVVRSEQTKIADNDGLPSSFVIQPRSAQMLSIPMNFDYKSDYPDLTMDDTLQFLIHACTPANLITDGSVPPGIDVTITGELHVWGLSWVWKPAFELDVDNVPCPVNARSLTTRPPRTLK